MTENTYLAGNLTAHEELDILKNGLVELEIGEVQVNVSHFGLN